MARLYKPLIKNTPRSKENPLKIAVLASGNGSNLEALIFASKKHSSVFEVSCVVVNEPKAMALEKASKANIPHKLICHKDFINRNDFEKAVLDYIKIHGVEIIVLAGFMRILADVLINNYPQKIINLHPSLLPSFKGIDAIAQAYNYPVMVTGCTVHLVNKDLDAGPILAQKAITIKPKQSLASLRLAIHALEHELLPKTINDIALGNKGLLE